MEFTVTTNYDRPAMTAMCRAMRKTVRAKRNLRSWIMGIAVLIFAAFLITMGGGSLLSKLVTALVCIVLAAALIWEDSLNAWITLRRVHPGMRKSTVTFTETGYHSEVELGSSDFRYDGILRIVVHKDYAVFLMGASHAQVYDMRTLSGGDRGGFLHFLTERTGLPVEHV